MNIMNNEEKILSMLAQIQDKLEQHDTMFAEQGKQLAEQGKQLAELSADVSELSADVSDLKSKVNDIDGRLIRVDSQLRRVAVTQENQMDKLVRLLDEDYSNIGGRLNTQGDAIRKLSFRVDALEKAN